MSEAINEFIRDEGNYKKVQEQLLIGYENDIMKYAESSISSRTYDIYNCIDVMLNNDNQKFKLTKIAVKA